MLWGEKGAATEFGLPMPAACERAVRKDGAFVFR